MNTCSSAAADNDTLPLSLVGGEIKLNSSPQDKIRPLPKRSQGDRGVELYTFFRVIFFSNSTFFSIPSRISSAMREKSCPPLAVHLWHELNHWVRFSEQMAAVAQQTADDPFEKKDVKTTLNCSNTEAPGRGTATQELSRTRKRIFAVLSVHDTRHRVRACTRSARNRIISRGPRKKARGIHTTRSLRSGFDSTHGTRARAARARAVRARAVRATVLELPGLQGLLESEQNCSLVGEVPSIRSNESKQQIGYGSISFRFEVHVGWEAGERNGGKM